MATRIGLLSDTHGLFDSVLHEFFAGVDQIWHAGDFGSLELADEIAAFKPLTGVYGNIDGGIIRRVYPQWQHFRCEEVEVMMTHIGGYPGRYERGVESYLYEVHPKLFISGHSHILRVGYDRRNGWLHINPGAAGVKGFHQVRTAVRFTIDGDQICDLEVGEWPKTVHTIVEAPR